MTRHSVVMIVLALTLSVAGCGRDSSTANPVTPPALASQQTENAKPAEQEVHLRQLEILRHEHGYKTFDTCMLTSEAELGSFIAELSRQEGWNNRVAFVSVLRTAKIDFTKSSLLLMRHTEGSGSVGIWLEPAVIRGDELVVRIGKDEPSMGTMNMAYYCFALAIPRDIAQRVRITGSFTPSRMVMTEDGKETLRPWHQDNIVFDL